MPGSLLQPPDEDQPRGLAVSRGPVRGGRSGPPLSSEDQDRFMAVIEADPPFSVLLEEDLRDLARRVRRTGHDRGHTIYREGEPARRLFVIERGLVRLSMPGPHDQERLVAILRPGEMFGELEVLDGSRRAMNAIAVEATSLYEIDRYLFRAVIKARPAFARRLLELLARRLRRADRAAQDLVFFDGSVRLARRLVELAEAHGRPTGQGEAIQIELELSQAELARMVGLNRSSANRLLVGFAARGLIDWNDGRPILLQPRALIDFGVS